MQSVKFLGCLCLLAVASCAPLETYYREGASLNLVERETTACEVSALGKVPVANQVRRLPPVLVPARRVCAAGGKCIVRASYYVPGGFETVDVNAGLRQRVEQQCMADKGFAPVSIPACPDSVARAAPAQSTTRLPELREGACVIRNRDGSVLIVNRS